MEKISVRASVMVIGLCLVLLLQAFLTGCGAEVKQTQEARASIEIYYPNCAQVEDDELLIECIEAASTVKVNVEGLEGLSDEEKDLLNELGINPNKGEI